MTFARGQLCLPPLSIEAVWQIAGALPKRGSEPAVHDIDRKDNIMKKALLCFIVIFFSLGISVCALEQGEYVSFGQYGGEPIVWRVLSGDAEGYFVIADKIVSFRPFDAIGSAWKDSSLRTWLNSAERDVSYLHPPQGDAQFTAELYDAEKGFLHADNFTPGEVAMLAACSREVIIHTPSASISPGNANAASRGYIRNPQTAQADAKDVDKEAVSDVMFLPSVSEIQQMALSHDRFGVEYQVGTPTAYAAEQAGTSEVKTGRGCCYWLSDALFFAAEKNYVYTMAPRNVISYARSYNGLVGVRPMCKIKNDKFFILQGDGSEEEPYILSTDQGIRIRAAQEVVMSGDAITVLVTSTFANDAVYEIYLNGAVCSGLPIARDGNNEVYYKVYASDGAYLGESNKINIRGISYNKLSDIMSCDFEGDDLFAGFVRHNAPEGYVKAVRVDETHGISLEAKSGNGAVMTASFPKFNQANITAVEFEFMLPSTDVIQNNLVNLKINGSGEWISPIAVKNGKLIVEDVSSECGMLDIHAGQWYHVGLYLDQSNPSLTVVVTENGVRHILCYRAAFAEAVDCFAYGEITSTGNSTAQINTVYFDNVSVYSGVQSGTDLYATAVMAAGQADVSVYNPCEETAELMVFGIVKNQGRLVECQREKITLTPADTNRAISFHFTKQGETGCMVLKPNLSPITVITEK